VIVGTVLLSPLFLIMRGKDVSIPKGTDVVAYVDGDREVALAGSGASATVADVSAAVITNDDVIKLKNAGMGDAVIIGKIKASKGSYHLETNDIIELKRVGISEAVIGAMLEASAPARDAHE
jgi:hypothetical protein